MSTPAAAPNPEKLDLVRRISSSDKWAVLSTSRPNGTIQASVVTAGVSEHPLLRQPMVAFVCRGGTVKLANMRRTPRVTIVFRTGSQWVTVEGRAWLIGPDDPAEGFDQADLPALRRQVFRDAGGTHENWDEYDRVMAEQRRAAVYIQLDRVYTNPGR